MSRLTGLAVNDIQSDREEISRKYAKIWNVVLVLKGYHTVIAHPDGRTIVNMTGGPGLATAGTGDVLMGVIAAFWADNLKKPFDAVATAVYLHGLAGDVATETIGEKSVIASDVIDILPEVIKIAQEKIYEKN
jgi:NAD(P)H-hydrate epimerase